MGAKYSGTKKIDLTNGSSSTGKTVPSKSDPRGGGTKAQGSSSQKQNTGGGGYGRASGVMKRGNGC